MNNFKRIGTFVIDMSILSMFNQIIMFLFTYFVHPTYSNITLDFIVFVIYIIIYIATAVLYQLICFKMVRHSLGHYLLNVRVYNIDKSERTKSQVLEREMYKYYLIYATIGLYVIYNAYLVLVRQKPSHLDQKFKTVVI